jgi:hypothetical protein
MLRRVAHGRTDVSKEFIASFITVASISSQRAAPFFDLRTSSFVKCGYFYSSAL